ncbi:MAG: SseB family protein [Cryobacterium sp.]|nr:SseB family protein [Cryobacterium sp.]MBX3090747.1 SseB family protein [Cryobacterium sp.]MCO5294137.1 SseB family protein [Homoserinimonas sp.]MCW5945361.1 SseB family protein [Cryobacterium sp.]
MAAFVPSSADSAGQPWAGRQFEVNRFPNDDGTAPPELIEAVSGFQNRVIGISEVARVFALSRVLVPLLTVLGEEGRTAEGKRVDKSQELSVVNVEAPDGRRALPVFSSVAAMSKWNPKARPVAIEGSRVAFSAVEEGTELVILDPMSETEIALRRPALWAIAQEEEWTPSFESIEVAEAFAASVSSESGRILEVQLSAGDPTARLTGAELQVSLVLAPGLEQSETAELLKRLTSRWAADRLITESVDSISVRVASPAEKLP